MNKKLFGTLLLGSLLLGGTFVSCKDYDDDIKNLQEQINNLATKSDVEAKLSQLQSALTTAQSSADAAKQSATQALATAEEALAAAKAADNTAEVEKLAEQIKGLQADIEAANAKIAEIEEAQEAVDAALEATKNEVSEMLAEFDEATKKLIADAQKKTEETVGKVADYVTGVTLVGTASDLQFTSSKITQANAKEFGKKDEYLQDKTQSANSTYSYVKDAFVKSPASVIVRVDPANAQISAKDVKIVDSKGRDLSGVIEVDTVYAYDGLLTRAENTTGLWKVVLKVADGFDSSTGLKGKTMDNSNDILYSVAVNNTLSSAANRYVMTDYAVTFDNTIAAYVGETSLNGVKISTTQNSGTFNASNTLVFDPSGDTKIYAANGETITVEFPKDSKADRFYVVRADDKASSDGGNNSINAWNRYSYEGLGEIKSITDGEKVTFKITIPEDLQVADDILFRLYAVNRDGSYVKDAAGHQHGALFRVHVGKGQNNSAIAANITAQTASAFSTGWIAYNGTLVDSNVKVFNEVTSATLKVNDNESHDVTIQYAKSLNADGTTVAPTKNTEIKYIKFNFTDHNGFKVWTDGATATGSIVTRNGGVKENVIDVALTKVLPTAEIAKKNLNYSWKASQLIGGVYTLYAYPAGLAWSTANVAAGEKDMKNVLNGLDALDANAYIKVTNAALEQKPYSNPAEYYWTGTVTANSVTSWNLSIDALGKSTDNLKLIDNKTQHKSVIGYNFGKISSEKVNGNYVDYTLDIEEFQTVFACPLATTVQTYAWKKYEAAATQTHAAVSKDLNVITYNQQWSEKAQDGTTPLVLTEYLIGTNSFDNTEFGGNFKTKYAKYVSVKAKLISNESGNEDYFTVTHSAGVFTFTPKSGTTNPATDVPSTLKITLTDCFGHENVYELPFTVKRAQ